MLLFLSKKQYYNIKRRKVGYIMSKLFNYNTFLKSDEQKKIEMENAYLLESIVEAIEGKVNKYNKDERVQFKLKGLLNQFVKENGVFPDKKDAKLICKVEETSTFDGLTITLNENGYLSESLHPIINDLVKEVYEDFRVDLEKYHYYLDTGNGDNNDVRIVKENE